MNRTFYLSLLLVISVLIPNISTASTARVNEGDGPMLHQPIHIEGIEDLNESNSVRSGSGSADDPFLIQDLIFNCTLSQGITISNISSHVLISSCVFYGSIYQSQAGIHIQNSSNITIMDCYSVYSLYAVRAVNSSSIHVSSSVFLGSEKGIDLVNTSFSSIMNTISSNNLISGVWMENCRYITLDGFLSEHNNAVLGGSNGLSSIDSTYVEVSNSTFDLCYGSGMMLLSDSVSSVISIEGSSFNNNHNGILADGDIVLDVLDCSFSENSYSIYLSGSGSSLISRCSFEKSDYGIYLTDVENAGITEDHFYSNDRDLVLDGSSYCTITFNTFNLSRELSLDINTYSSMDISSQNQIFWNEFLGETPKFGFARDKGESTTWSMDGRGNLWYDGGVPDRNDDGVCDIPYDINGDGSVMDPHPEAHELDIAVEEVIQGSNVHDSDLSILLLSMAVSVSIIMMVVLLHGRSDP